MNFEIQPIGSIKRSIDGSDEYLLVKCEEDTSPEKIRRHLNDVWAWGSKKSRQYFCAGVDVIPHAQGGKYIGIIYHRFEIQTGESK